MGYSTDFIGGFKLDKAANAEQINYINTFSSTRRMTRNPDELFKLYNGEFGFKGKYGIEGEYFAREDGDFGQTKDSSIISYNSHPSTQPGLWCQWILSEDGTELIWDDNEKLYNYVNWLKYLIDNFFTVWDIKLSGEIKYQGEDMEDRGLISVVDNLVTSKKLA